MAKKFEKHMMYGPNGEEKMAKTYQEHLDLQDKGWGHEKPSSPLNYTPGYKGMPTTLPSTNFTKLGSIMSGGEDDFGGGAGSVGYQVKWDKVDFGKSILEKAMKDNEKDIIAKKKKDEEEEEEEEVLTEEVPTEEVLNEKEVVKTDNIEKEVPTEEIVETENVETENVETENVEDGDPTKPSQSIQNEQIGKTATEQYNISDFSKKYTKEEQQTLFGELPKQNPTPEVFPGANVDGKWNKQLGGGNHKIRMKPMFKNGKFSGVKNSGRDWNYTYKVKGKEPNQYIQFPDLNKMGQGVDRVFKKLGGSKNGRFTQEGFKDFTNKYMDLLKEAQANLEKYKEQGLKGQKLVQAFKDNRAQMVVLRMHARGFTNSIANFKDADAPTKYKSPLKQPVESKPGPTPENPLFTGVPYSRAYLKSIGINPDVYYSTLSEQTKQPPKPPRRSKSNSPFPQIDRSFLKVRENWMPTESPMNYDGVSHEEYVPFKQTEQEVMPTNIWEKISSYGKGVDKKIKRFVKSVKYDPSSDKPIASFQNPAWKNTINQWLQSRKMMMVEAVKNNDKQTQQGISDSVISLIQDVTTYSNKFLDWVDRNSGENAPGSAGGSVVSLGSKKDEKFIGDMTFMGDLNTNIAIGEDGKIGIKSFGLDGLKYVEDLDLDVFAKDDAGKMTFLEASGKLEKDAEAGKPINPGIISGYADELLKNEDSILSWAFDPLYGRSWIQDWSEANPDVDVSMFMPESSNFDIDALTDELHGWLSSKLTDAYNASSPQQKQQMAQQNEQNTQQIMNQTLANVEQEKQNKQGVYAENPQQQQQGSPLTQKSSRALELLRKYSK